MALASILAGVVSYGTAAPFYFQKTKLQGLSGFVDWGTLTYKTGIEAGQGLRYPSSLVSVRATVAAGDVFALWDGTNVLLLRGVGLTMGHLVAYDWTKSFAKETLGVRDTPMLHVAASVHAAVWAST
eukprot:CAMPEP_0185790660 /NCGR_PEP_ID=MMETSP1174-20130828/157520_1 /TAXON_ID=35687 /ORGANISM="Dictyocha speculum, Strain CCMP1381" /LENGTH=126 /DNA_ID=CAMNT_0028485453 /DNA_START=135 /DNA_END=511 /DNA_ORIENTATION=+